MGLLISVASGLAFAWSELNPLPESSQVRKIEFLSGQ
jgi:hypothetical protein